METDITSGFVVPFLFVVTIGAIIVFALMSKKKTEQRKRDQTASKSTLAEDASNKR